MPWTKWWVAYDDGCEAVCGVRSSRRTDTSFKHFTAESCYRLINRMGGREHPTAIPWSYWRVHRKIYPETKARPVA